MGLAPECHVDDSNERCVSWCGGCQAEAREGPLGDLLSDFENRSVLAGFGNGAGFSAEFIASRRSVSMSVDRWCNLGGVCDESFCTGCRLRYLYCETQPDASCGSREAQECMQRCSECPTPPGMDGDHSGYTGSGPSQDGSDSGPWHDSGSGMPQGSGGNRCDEVFCTGCLRYLYCETQP